MDYGPWTIDQMNIFSRYADKYTRYRPGYPDELFEFLAGLTEHSLAWDCGTGNGQSAAALSRYYEHVYATDISSEQLSYAVAKDNIRYVQESAEKTKLKDNSVDLVTISQALHWFDLPAFYKEVKRTGRENGVIAAWTYSLLNIDQVIDDIILEYYNITLKEYWSPERRYVDEEYNNILFPFSLLPVPSFSIRLNWTKDELEGYLNTWSATQKFIAANHFNPMNEVMNKIRVCWPDDGTRSVNFPLHIKVGRIH